MHLHKRDVLWTGVKAAIGRLSSRGKRPFRVGPETQLAIWCSDYLRLCVLDDVFWLHIPNEGKRGKAEAWISQCMGFLPGAPDYILYRPGQIQDEPPRLLLVELKSDKGVMSPDQQHVEAWCREHHYSYQVIRTLDSFIDLCLQYGLTRS